MDSIRQHVKLPSQLAVIFTKAAVESTDGGQSGGASSHQRLWLHVALVSRSQIKIDRDFDRPHLAPKFDPPNH